MTTKKGKSPIRFSRHWEQLIDEDLPNAVKQAYCPKENWKKKPFGDPDAHFFLRSVRELSELFTEERPTAMPPYLQHPKFRSAYLLYFLPLQAAKFQVLLQLHETATRAAFDEGKRKGELRVLDLGAGPGTASLSLLVWLLDHYAVEDLPKLRFDWFDTNKRIMEDGRSIIDRYAKRFPGLGPRLEVVLHAEPWWKADAAVLVPSIILLGNILNEHPDQREGSLQARTVHALSRKAGAGGCLIIEPANRESAQTIARIRNTHPDLSIHGPCLHTGPCPLAEGRDWCHFSVPVEIPGKWFRFFSKGLGSVRQWVKFSYLWLASAAQPNTRSQDDTHRLVVSDPLRGRGGEMEVLVCEPERVGRVPIQNPGVKRGDVIEKKIRLAPFREPAASKGRLKIRSRQR